ncbi:hypothetical protein [Flavobacterium sp.]|uniref:hypothetical protein n=1 Tax=Flavobacterium sp. TaxID=239 RepID=UPI0031DDFD97
MASKLRCYIINNALTFSLFIVYSGFIFLKVKNLDNYNFYEGKIIGLREITSSHTSGRGGSVLINRNIPEVEYYKGKDTIRYDQGELRLVTNFELNEKVTILENKENEYENKIYSLFYYWIDYNELILFLLAFLFVFGYIKNFIK